MKLLLVPWATSWNVALRVYARVPERVSDYEAEVSTKNGQKVMAELLRKEACSVKPIFLDFFRRVVFEAGVPDAVAGRLLKAFKAVGRFRNSRQIPERLAENPSLEELEKFLREAGAPEYLPQEEVAGMKQESPGFSRGECQRRQFLRSSSKNILKPKGIWNFYG